MSSRFLLAYEHGNAGIVAKLNATFGYKRDRDAFKVLYREMGAVIEKNEAQIELFPDIETKDTED